MCLLSCSAQRDHSPALAQFYVGPATLPLRKEMNPKSSVITTVRHGEALDVIETKRRFFKVRTAGGITGWAEARQLLTPDKIAELKRLSKEANAMPPQGVATTFEMLNVHVEPSRASASFAQVPEGGKVVVVGHKLLQRIDSAPPLPMPPPRPKVVRTRKKDRVESRLILPPMPPAPKPPANWLQLSQSDDELPSSSFIAKPPAPKSGPPPAPPRMDDWALIKTNDGKVGWVLSSMISMALPDEMLRYAEGHRITSYFVMGDIHDDELNETKHNWLWTTVGKGAHEYEFDSYRFFIWSKHRHRYETAFIQKNVVGHYPVKVDRSAAEPVFSVIVDDDDGKPVMKTYAFNGFRVNLTDVSPYDSTGSNQPASSTVTTQQNKPAQKTQAWYEAIGSRITRLFRH